MKICKTSAKCCECKKNFENGYELQFNKMFFKNIKLCSACAENLNKDLSKFFIPKSPKNVVIRKKRN